MKVLHIINSMGVGGAEKLVALLVPALRRHGIEADLLVIDRHRSIFIDQLESDGINNVRNLGLNNFYNPFSVVKLWFFFLRNSKQYDVIHSHLFPAQYWLAFAATLCRVRAPLVTTEQNTTNRRRNIAFFKVLDKFIYRRYSVITTVSPIATEFLENYVKADDIHFLTIPNAIDLSVFDNAPEIDLAELTGCPADSIFAIQVSTFTAQKDHDTLISAIPRCDEKLQLILVGEGERKAEMQALARQLNVFERVHFIGIRNDVPALLCAADIAVLSSHHEGLSLSLLEAFASGTPFIGTDSPGLGEIARQGGVSVASKDVDDLANALNRFATDKQFSEETSMRGLALAQKYSIDRIAEQYAQAYARVA